MADWQPIETAPKDRNILTWNGTGHAISWWMIGLNMWNAAGHSLDYVEEHQPTHWLPLPDPPETVTQ